MSTKKTLMLEYSDWLFEDQSSIIYEQRRDYSDSDTGIPVMRGLRTGGGTTPGEAIRGVILRYLDDPEHVADIAQMFVGFAGAIPVVGPVIDVGNAAVYALRGHYGAAVIQLIATIPAIGDVIGSFVNGLTVLIRGAGGAITRAGLPTAEAIAQALTTISTNPSIRDRLLTPSVEAAVQYLVQWFSTNIIGLRQAFSVTNAYVRARVALANIPAGDMERRGVSATFVPMVQSILASVDMSEAFRTLYPGLNSGIDAAHEMVTGFDAALNTLERSSDEVERVAAASGTSTTTGTTGATSIAESYTDIRFKKIAGITK